MREGIRRGARSQETGARETVTEAVVQIIGYAVLTGAAVLALMVFVPG